MVVTAPIATNIHPIARRRDSGIRPDRSRPTPAPSAPRVPAINATSGIVSRIWRIRTLRATRSPSGTD